MIWEHDKYQTPKTRNSSLVTGTKPPWYDAQYLAHRKGSYLFIKQASDGNCKVLVFKEWLWQWKIKDQDWYQPKHDIFPFVASWLIKNLKLAWAIITPRWSFVKSQRTGFYANLVKSHPITKEYALR